MPFVSRRADLLERSLHGLAGTDPEVRDLVATAGRIPALTSRSCSPRPEFVSELGLRLRAEALTLPARQVATAGKPGRQATKVRRPVRRPQVLVIGRGLPRILLGAVASLLVVAAVVGGTSRSALPGSLFYPVRQLLDQAAVQLAGNDFDRGVTLLSQAQEHISDAGALADRDGAQADPASVDQALLNAYDAVEAGQSALFGRFDRTGSPQALIAVQDFVVQSLPQLGALRPMVPAASRTGVDALIALLNQTRTTLAAKAAVCGQPCAFMDSTARAGSFTFAPPTGLPSTLAPGGGTGVTVPTVSVPLVTLAPIPGVSASVPATSVPLVTLVPIPGISTSVPSLPSLPVPLVTLAPIPGVSISAPLP